MDDHHQDRPPKNRTREAATRSPSGAGATAVPPLDAAAASAETETSACSGGVGRQGGDGGLGGCGGGTVESLEKADKEQQAETETGAPAQEVLGFYVDCRPDPELLKLVAQERETARSGGNGERSTQGNGPGEEPSSSGSGAGGVGGRGDRPPPEPESEPTLSGLPATSAQASRRAKPAEEAPQTWREASRASEPSGEGKTTRAACVVSVSSLSPKGKGKKRPRSSSPSSMRSLECAESEGSSGGGKRFSREEAGGDDGDKAGDGRLRAVFKPDGGGWMFVKGEDKGNNTDPRGGGEEEDEDGGAKRSATFSVQEEDRSNNDTTGPAATLDELTEAASGSGETAAQLAERLRAESERTARLTVDAAKLAAKLSSAQVDGGASAKRGTAALPPPPSRRSAFKMGGGDVGDVGDVGGGDGARSRGPRHPDQVERGEGTSGKGGGMLGDDNDGGGNGEPHKKSADEEEEEDEEGEVRHADGLMALVREQERRNRGGSLPPTLLPTTATDNGQGGGRPGEISRATRLQVCRWNSFFVLYGGRAGAAVSWRFGSTFKRARSLPSRATLLPPHSLQPRLTESTPPPSPPPHCDHLLACKLTA